MELAFVFPGQGAQYIGMGKDLYDTKIGRKFFDMADEVLGRKISGLCFNGPEEKLKETANTQPAIFTVSMICYYLLKEYGISPVCCAGHSLGEYAALVAAGFVDFKTGLYLVVKRGEFMQELNMLDRGAPMAAVLGLEIDKIKDLIREIDGVYPAIHNGYQQTVIAGDPEQVKKAGEILKQNGAKRVVELKTSGPFHTELMEPAAEKFKHIVQEVKMKKAELPLIANVSAKPVTDPHEMKELLVKQIYQPILWVDSINKIIESSVKNFVEIGPGKVLKGLIKKIDRSVTVHNVSDLQRAESIKKEFSSLSIKERSEANVT